MTLSKLQAGLVAIAIGAIAGVLVWEMRMSAGLRAKAFRQSAAAATNASSLEKQIVVQSQRLAAAEASIATLLKSANLARQAHAASPGRNVSVDTEDAVKAAMARATQLINDGNPQEALDEYLKCYRELQAIRPGSPECQRLMTAIKNLGRTYPNALSALGALRDSAVAQWRVQPGRRELPFEIALLNERLGEGSRTLELYDSLPANDPGRQSLAMIARNSFIEARRYSDALIGKPFGQMLNMIETGLRQIGDQDASRQALFRAAVVEGTVTNIEVLTGAGKTGEARILTEKILAFDGSNLTRALIDKHVARAGQPPTP